MTYPELILPEFDQEMANTRKVLERVPDEKLEWKAHPTLQSIGWNAAHLAEIPGWVEGTIAQTEWDIAPPEGEPYRSPQLGSRQEILALFDANVAAARAAIAKTNEAEIAKNWSLLSGGQVLMTVPRSVVIRTWVINHSIHHRAHLLVYLRLNDVPAPGMYGPSGGDAG
jgi:uncharacterized damage-inducible protein DinB